MLTPPRSLATDAIAEAILAHRIWVSRFRQFLSGNSTERFAPATARDDQQCNFGRWLNGPAGERFAPAALAEIQHLHRSFHETAGDVAYLMEQQAPREEVALYLDALDALSRQLVSQLRKLKGEDA